MPDDHLRRLAEQNRGEIQRGKEVVFGIAATVESHTAEIQRNKSDLEKLDERMRVISEAAGANASRDIDQDRRMQDLQTRQTRTDQQVGELSVVVTEAVGAARSLTGAFQDMKTQIDGIRAETATEEQQSAEGFDAWLRQWREAATPTNAVLLIVLLTTIGGLLRGEITRADAAQQLRTVAIEAAIEAQQLPQTEPAPAE